MEAICRNIEEVLAENEQLRLRLQEQEAKNQNLGEEVENLKLLIQKLKIQAFGKKSEKLTEADLSAQEELFTFDASPSAEAAPAKVPVAAHQRDISRGRKPLPSNLERERVEYEPETRVCGCCGAELEKIGEEITEELDYIPARFLVREHVKIQRACSKCKQAGVQTGVLPPSVQPLERSRPGAGLLSHIMVAKYVDHIPLNRQETIFARAGVILSRARMCDWVAAVCALLKPLHEALRLELIALPYLQADETTLKVQDPEAPKNILTGYIWGIHAPPQSLAYFEYYPTRASEAAMKLLDGFAGTAQTDYYAGYNPVLLPGTVRRLACMAHVRRKFIETQKAAPEACRKVLEMIAGLYRIETKAKDLSFLDRENLRRKESIPILEKVHEYLKQLDASTLPKHALKQAINYALSQWKEIVRYTEDGMFEIDNNAMERDIRPIAIGRKNYLFAGSHEGAKRAAMLYSFFACCKLHKVNAFEWLKDVIVRVQTDRTVSAADLLPHRWKSIKD